MKRRRGSHTSRMMDERAFVGEYTSYSPYFPNVYTCSKEIFGQLKSEVVERLPVPTVNGIHDWFRETWEWHYISFYWSISDLGHVIAIALALTLIRFILSKILFEPLPRKFKLLEENVKKFPESAWRTIVYSALWGWALYLCIVNEKQYFFYPVNHWIDWIPGSEVPTEIYWLYMFQMGLYVHSIYTTIFVDEIRKDFVVMLLHHFLTLGLLSYSIGVGFHVIGLLVLFVQDFGDISLELSKCILYFKVRDGVECKFTDNLSNVSFGVFTLQWILLRLYWLPTKVLYSSCFVCVQFYPKGPFYLSFNVLLIALYLMQVYWFSFIVKLLMKMVLTGETSVEDTRETEGEKEKVKKALKEVQKKKGM